MSRCMGLESWDGCFREGYFCYTGQEENRTANPLYIPALFVSTHRLIRHPPALAYPGKPSGDISVEYRPGRVVEVDSGLVRSCPCALSTPERQRGARV